MCDFDSCETCNSASTGSYNGMPITRPPMPPNPSTAIDKSMYNPSIHCHRIYRNDLYGNFFCNKCNQYKNGSNYVCQPCNFNCCLGCFNYFNR